MAQHRIPPYFGLPGLQNRRGQRQQRSLPTFLIRGYRRHLVAHAAALGIDLEISARTPRTRGFTPIPKRWTVERTYGRLMLHRRLARDCEILPARSEAMIHLAVTDLMARRLTGENTISWRDPTPQGKRPIPG